MLSPPFKVTIIWVDTNFLKRKERIKNEKAEYIDVNHYGFSFTSSFCLLGRGKKIGLILATGGLGDKSFNDISYAGAVRASEELGVELDYVEPQAVAEFEGYQRDFASSQEYEIIVCVGFDQAVALVKIAQEFPEQKFALVDMTVDQPNVASLLFKANEEDFFWEYKLPI